MRARTYIFFLPAIFGVAFLVGTPVVVFAATTAPTNITTDTAWVASGSPYVVSSNLEIASGSTLTIDPGTVVKIGLGINITVAGALNVQGNTTAPVIFTSTSDDSDGNDTNGDATTTTASYLPWGQIIINHGATANFLHTDLRYGGSYPPSKNSGGDIIMPLPGVIINNGKLSFIDSILEHADFSGGILSNGILTFTHSAIHDIYTGVVLNITGTSTISQSSFGIKEYIETANADVTFSKSSVAEPIMINDTSTMHDGGGNVTPLMLAWIYFERGATFPPPPFINLVPYLSVGQGTTLTVLPGAIVKMYGEMDVYGTLITGSANSTATTTFTSYADDSAGGNTTSINGSATSTPGDWLDIIAEKGSHIKMHHTAIKYAGDPDADWMYDTFNTTNAGYAGQLINLGGTISVSDSEFTHALTNDITQIEGTTTITHSKFPDGKRFAYIFGGAFNAHDNSITMPSGIGIKNATTTVNVNVNATNNWWGDASGPQNANTNPTGKGPSVSAHVLFTPWLTSDPLTPQPKVHLASNVLFLPGIEGSRLYEGTGCGKSKEEKLWEPASFPRNMWSGDTHVGELALNAKGKSVCADIYAKPGEIVDSVYSSFENEMNKLKSNGTINNWEPVAYDWRLSLNDLLANGTQRDGKIFYEEATSTPYIEQTLRSLAASSKTGKVTIIAHSNGGLVAKALLAKLGPVEAAKLVDRVIMVAAPQSGAPADIGSLLVGYNVGIYKYGVPIVSNQAARTFAQNSPMAYHLLPSEDYLESTLPDISTHPVIKFEGSAYAKAETAYGTTIANRSALDNFLLAKGGDRTQPTDSNLSSAKILNPTLIKYANREHDALDSWVPPKGIKVDEIAGWGVDTVQGIDFYSQWSLFGPKREYRPIFIEDGDGTVTVPSALEMASSTNVKRYWMNLDTYHIATNIKHTHGDILEVPQLQDFIKNIIEDNKSPFPLYISSTTPVVANNTKKLTFFLHSPLTLQITDSSGNVTGIAKNGTVTQSIPGSAYGKFGDVKYVTVPEGSAYSLTMHGQASGTFSLDMQESSGNTVTSLSTIANVPTTANTLANLTISGGVNTVSPLSVDENGNGHILTIVPHIGSTVLFDITPPEATIGFSTSTKKIEITGIDETSTTTSTSTATSTTITDLAGNWLTIGFATKLNRNHGNDTHWKHRFSRTHNSWHKREHHIALHFNMHFTNRHRWNISLHHEFKFNHHVKHNHHKIHKKMFRHGTATLNIKSLSYSTGTTTNATATLRYLWNTNKHGKFTTFVSSIRTPTNHIFAVYTSRLNKTYIVALKNLRYTKIKLHTYIAKLLRHKHLKVYNGLYVPSIVTKQGKVLINY